MAISDSSGVVEPEATAAHYPDLRKARKENFSGQPFVASSSNITLLQLGVRTHTYTAGQPSGGKKTTKKRGAAAIFVVPPFFAFSTLFRRSVFDKKD